MKLIPEIMVRATAEYDKPEVREFARLASVQEFECYTGVALNPNYARGPGEDFSRAR
jgi:hypothetical protein